MREIAQIIETLDQINRQVIEKDNLIDQVRPLIQLITDLSKDLDLN